MTNCTNWLYMQLGQLDLEYQCALPAGHEGQHATEPMSGWCDYVDGETSRRAMFRVTWEEASHD